MQMKLDCINSEGFQDFQLRVGKKFFYTDRETSFLTAKRKNYVFLLFFLKYTIWGSILVIFTKIFASF